MSDPNSKKIVNGESPVNAEQNNLDAEKKKNDTDIDKERLKEEFDLPEKKQQNDLNEDGENKYF